MKRRLRHPITSLKEPSGKAGPTVALATLLAAACALLLTAAPALALSTHLFSTSFGSTGSGDGQVSSPQGVAVNEATHDVYVADTGNHRVDQFDPSKPPAERFIRAFGAGVGGAGVNVCTSGCLAGTSASTPGAFQAPTFIAVDNSAGPSHGDVYVGDTGTNLVQKFTSAGALVTSWGDDSSPTTPAPNGQLNGSAATGGPFTAIAGIAVDTSGNLFVYDPNNQNWFEFAQDGTADPTVPFSRGTLNNGIGVDAAGHFYKIVAVGNLEQYDTSGNDLGEVTGGAGGITGFAVDPSNNDVYADDGGALIRHYDSSCVPSSASCTSVDSFGTGHLNGGAGLAVDSSSHTVYAADQGNARIDVFTAVVLPDATTNPASNVDFPSGTATLNATVNAAGTTITDCHFEYVTNDAFNATGFSDLSSGGSVACDSTPTGSTPTSVHANLTGLTHHVYDFRISATNAAGTKVGSDQLLTPFVRNFDTQLTGLTPPNAPVPGPFSQPQAIAIDSADNAWVGDPGRGVISVYDPLGGYLSQQTGGGQFGGGGSGINALALNYSTGSLVVADSNAFGSYGKVIDIFDSAGAFVKQVSISASGGCGGLWTAVDNSGGPSQGRIYALNNCVGAVQAFDASGAPVNFSASAGYISGNEITGTPSGPFSSFGAVGVATDTHGNIYVVDQFEHVVDEFDSSGTFVQAFTGAGAPGGFSGVSGVAVDPTNGNVLIVSQYNDVIDEFDSAGNFLDQITGPSPTTPFGQMYGSIAVNSAGYVYVADNGRGVVDVFLPTNFALPLATTGGVSSLTRTSVTLNANADPNRGGDVTGCQFSVVAGADYRPWADDPYAAGPSAGTAACLDGGNTVVGTSGNPIESPTDVHADLTGLQASTTYHYRLSLTNADGTRHGADRTFTTPPAVTDVSTGSATDITNASATLHGSFTGDGHDTSFYFAYGTGTNYGHTSATPPGADQGMGTGTQNVSMGISGLVPNTTYHYALVATNSFGTTVGPDQTFTTFQPPTIDAFSTSNVTATSADLNAQINPQGFDTAYHVEYGTTTAYGAMAPVPDASIGSATSDQSVVVHLSGLQPGVVYHFRVIATSKWGTATSADQTFEFFPPACPNSAVRQQTGSAYLPDCRGYEIVSPGDAAGTLLFPGGPNTGQATSPSRFSFVGDFSALPGVNAIGSAGDLYVATRTDSGWVSRYIGLPGNQAGCMGGPPGDSRSHASGPNLIQNAVLTDPGMNRFLDWVDGAPAICVGDGQAESDASMTLATPSNAPYLWSAGGVSLGRLPTNLGSTPGAAAALTCLVTDARDFNPKCPGDVTASGDLTHLVFSSGQLAFAPGGLTVAPGSAYDNNLATNTVTKISVLPGTGGDIPQEPGYTGPKEFIRFPAVSTDGSHILMSTATATTPPCRSYANGCPRSTDFPVHLYMRVGDAVTYDVSAGHDVNYVGMTPDGSKVYFTSPQQLTPDDTDTSTDLYMWSESTNSLTRLSAATGAGAGAGNSDSCSASWTAKCGVLPYSSYLYSRLNGGLGGNGISDNSIAVQNGDIYFYSPEQLDGDHGVQGQQNLYDYRNGKAQYVTTFSPGVHCTLKQSEPICSDGPVVRLQVSPDDSHMAFLTDNRITSYDNAGHLEMYSYTPSTGAIVCDSCRPDGQPPSADVVASQDGLFMTDDGRTFFSTTDPLVPQDTNHGEDVYEFVDGRPQLITSGTGTVSIAGVNLVTLLEVPGLVGVSADGTDVYFSTYDSLVSEDHNGSFLKFYDARTNGGFPQPPPAPPCVAAEECHGLGSSAPALPTQGTAASLSGGNFTTQPRSKRHKKKHHRKKHHRKASAKRHRAGHANSSRRAAR